MEYNGYCVRLQAHEGYESKILALPLNLDYVSIVAMKHKGGTGENPHYHLVVRTDVKDQAFRVRLRKVFDAGKGNAHMSIKAWDGNIDAVSYLFHEDPTGSLLLKHNVSDETITKARERNRDVQEKVATAKERASWKIEEEIYQQYLTSRAIPDLHQISKDIILFALRHDRYVPNDFLLKSMAYKIQFRLIDGDQNEEETFAKNYVARVYRMDYEQERQWMQSFAAPPPPPPPPPPRAFKK